MTDHDDHMARTCRYECIHPQCDLVIEGMSPEEVARKALEHIRAEHTLSDIPQPTYEEILAAVKKEG